MQNAQSPVGYFILSNEAFLSATSKYVELLMQTIQKNAVL